ncbi:MAG: AarF/ABC1/UbiB kinase family protein [Deltaproteobacteria bacterium]|nr:MAG: AarF/ABC1/UbiB kinase family protein [Deltaproteobacteria bacterium]
MLNIGKIGVIGRTYRHLNRYRKILRVLFRYGFGDLVDTLKIEQYLEIGLQVISRKRREKIEKLSRPERVRMALEELGPTFIKLGQILSTRPDLIPVAYVEELSKLQDQTSPVPYGEIREIVRAETGKFPEDLFASFEPVPLAAASIGQVHRATLEGGENVVVKIQRPGIRKLIEVDLEIMLHLAGLMERHLEGFEIQRPTRIVEEFARTLEKEIDYRVEAAHMARFSRQFADDDSIYVPGIFEELTTRRMLTTEFIDGIKASRIDTLRERGYDLTKIMQRGVDAVMKQVFVHGFFHADPHPGNILILPENVVCFIDFGMMGRITGREREDFSDFLVQVVRGDERKAADAAMRLSHYDREPDRERLERDLLEAMETHLYHPVEKLRIGKLLQRLLEIFTRHSLSLKPDLFLTMKALATLEGLARTLDPDFNIMEHARPFVRRIRSGRFSPGHVADDVLETGAELYTLIKEVPSELRAILKQAKEGKIRIEFEHMGLEPVLFTHDRTSNRIAFAIVLAALIIGSSLIALSDIPPKWHDIPIIGLAGFIIAGVMGFWLLLSILRRGRM